MEPVVGTPDPTKLIGDRYEVLCPLDEGGMGSVLKARNINLSKTVAIKVLHHSLVADDSIRTRFEIEAKSGSKLNHPNLITVFDFGYMPSGEPYLVMEFIEGLSLGNMLERFGPAKADQILPILIQSAKALKYLHENHIVHRDLKPANIMVQEISGERYAKLVDLGIAKVFSAEGPTQHLTATGSVFGSPLYMSPEQCRGEKVDAHSDVYSFGCVIYACLTGAPPFGGENALQTIYQHVNSQPQPLPVKNSLDEQLAQLVDKCLAKDPASRYADGGELLKALVAIDSNRTGPIIVNQDRSSSGLYEGRTVKPEKAVIDSQANSDTLVDRPEPAKKRGGLVLFAMIAIMFALFAMSVVTNLVMNWSIIQDQRARNEKLKPVLDKAYEKTIKQLEELNNRR